MHAKKASLVTRISVLSYFPFFHIFATRSLKINLLFCLCCLQYKLLCSNPTHQTVILRKETKSQVQVILEENRQTRDCTIQERKLFTHAAFYIKHKKTYFTLKHIPKPFCIDDIRSPLHCSVVFRSFRSASERNVIHPIIYEMI